MFNPVDVLHQDMQTIEQFEAPTVDVPTMPALDVNSFDATNSKVFTHPDPLSQAMHYEMPSPKLHMVKPHFVDSYVRADGTVVEGYYRDGDIPGSSYVRSNPDEFTENNVRK